LSRIFIIIDDEQAIAVTLWIAFTWFIDEVEVAPLAIINAPEKACGKSQLLDLIGRMSARPLAAANTSTACLFRVCELHKPTLLIDEADTFIRDNQELKGLINAGHTRSNAFVLRVVGDNHEPKKFSVWGAKALAGIALEKHLPDATMSRGIVINMRRKMANESVTRLRHAECGLFESICSKLSRFADDYSQQVRLARPVLPAALSDRAQDNWEPLLAIAGCAGDAWLKRGTAAALTLSSASEESISIGNELLLDIQHVFATLHADKISTADLISKLAAEDSDSPWATYNRGNSISPRQLAKLLATYGIKSKTVRMKFNSTPKGYDTSQFIDVFARYLSPSEILPPQRNVLSDPMQDMANTVADNDVTEVWIQETEPVAATQTLNATSNALAKFVGGGVADKTPDVPKQVSSVTHEDF
jgi:putative DNA primase/helicase